MTDPTLLERLDIESLAKELLADCDDGATCGCVEDAPGPWPRAFTPCKYREAAATMRQLEQERDDLLGRWSRQETTIHLMIDRAERAEAQRDHYKQVANDATTALFTHEPTAQVVTLTVRITTLEKALRELMFDRIKETALDASSEDYSKNWTDFSFDHAAEDFPPPKSEVSENLDTVTMSSSAEVATSGQNKLHMTTSE